MDCVDELQRPISLPAYPQRIVSLVPSITETLFALGAGASVVGVTSFCTHPPEQVAGLTKVGGTKNPDLEAILRLRPDVVILNEEENRREDFGWLEEHGLCVYVTAPRTVRDGIDMIERLGRLTGRSEDGQTLAHALRQQADRLATDLKDQPRLRVFCPIWRKPWMSFNAQTYIDDMLWTCGGENIFRTKAERYCTVSLDEVAAADPQVVVLPSEPYPFAAKHFVHLKPLAETVAGKMGHLYCVDGMALCWHGPRIADGLTQLGRLFGYVRHALDD
jgi:ABC-type Fe3+-hydroxamate transport system substrate-binding protein